MRLRTSFRLSLAALLIVGAATVTAAPSGADDDVALSDSAWAKQVCKQLPADELQRTWDGLRMDRSGDIQFFARDPDFVGSGLPHVGPWDYVQAVPMFWYGPGYIKPGVVAKRQVTSADIAATFAELTNFDWTAPDGKPMIEALEPEATRKVPPKMIITVIWDSAGTNVMDEWPNDWPYLDKLASQGSWFDNATLGLSPTSTAQGHATIGTGAMPRSHALVAHHFRIGQNMTTPWSQGSRLLTLPTFSDLYDRANGNEPKIAMIGSVPIHLGMMSHGTEWGGGDKDIAVLTNVNDASTLGAESPTWGMPLKNKPFYYTPEWVDPDQDPATVDYRQTQYYNGVDAVDQMDGRKDGKWRDESIEDLKGGFETPARIPWENSLVKDLIRKEGLGTDASTDMLFVNYKVIDFVGHVWSMNSEYMSDSLKFQDQALEELVPYLDKEVGKGQYVLLVTADHGAMPDPKVTGAFVASPGRIGSAINNKFGEGTVMLTQNSTAFLNVPQLEANGDTVGDVARFVGTLTKGETYLEGYEPTGNEAKEKLFQSSFPSYLMEQMPCIQTETDTAPPTS